MLSGPVAEEAGGRRWWRRCGDGERDWHGDRESSDCIERDVRIVGSRDSGASCHRHCHNAIACASGRTQRQPVDILSGAPGERASPCITDAQGLGRRVAATLCRSEGETCRTRPDSRWHGSCCHGKRYWYSDRGRSRSTE